MVVASSRVDALELAMRYMLRLYFVRLLAYMVWVWGIVAFFGT